VRSFFFRRARRFLVLVGAAFRRDMRVPCRVSSRHCSRSLFLNPLRPREWLHVTLSSADGRLFENWVNFLFVPISPRDVFRPPNLIFGGRCSPLTRSLPCRVSSFFFLKRGAKYRPLRFVPWPACDLLRRDPRGLFALIRRDPLLLRTPYRIFFSGDDVPCAHGRAFVQFFPQTRRAATPPSLVMRLSRLICSA